MNHRERLLSIFEGSKPDRVPRDLGSTIWTTMDGKSYENLKRYLDIESITQYKNLGFQAVEIDNEILDIFDIDTRGLTTKGPTGWVDIVSDEGIYIDEWGIKRNVPASSSIIEHPFAVDDYGYRFLDDYSWPDGKDAGRFEGFQQIFKQWHTEGEYATVLNIFGGFTTMSYLLRGLDNWCVDMLVDEELFSNLLDRTLQFEIDSARTALDVLGEYVDIVGIADDFAGQNGLLFSPKHFRQFIKPRLENLIDVIREYCDCRILFHCCGSVSEIIPDFIELGIDALNPFQVTASGMDPAVLKESYNDKIIFWGGIDTQQILSKGTEKDVVAEVERILAIMDGCGYVLSAVHNIQGDVPPENVVQLFNYK
jgi:uroporphyrinogen decarboxylase